MNDTIHLSTGYVIYEKKNIQLIYIFFYLSTLSTLLIRIV
jgi:hypothetical protein